VGHGGLYRTMLPHVLSNLDLKFVLAHPVGHAEAIIAEPGQAGLVCTSWCGMAVPGP
jgi:hypothetical protein